MNYDIDPFRYRTRLFSDWAHFSFCQSKMEAEFENLMSIRHCRNNGKYEVIGANSSLFPVSPLPKTIMQRTTVPFLEIYFRSKCRGAHWYTVFHSPKQIHLKKNHFCICSFRSSHHIHRMHRICFSLKKLPIVEFTIRNHEISAPKINKGELLFIYFIYTQVLYRCIIF